MTKRTRVAWSAIGALALLLALSGAGAAWAGLRALGNLSATPQSQGVKIAAPGDSENGLIYIHDVVFDGCNEGNISVAIQMDYDFPTPPHVRIVESLDGSEVGSGEGGEIDTFFSDSPQTDKAADVENDFAMGELGMNSTYVWDLTFFIDDAPVAEWVLEGDCGEESAMASEVYPAPALPGPAVLGAALLLLGIGIATLRSRG